MEVNSNPANVNFQAKLVFVDKAGEMKPYKCRLSNISKLFEEKTAKRPNDTLEISDCNGGISVMTYIKGLEERGTFSKEGLVQLFKLSDDAIATKFSKFLKMADNVDDIAQKAYKFYDSLSKDFEHKGISLNDENFWSFISSAQTAAKQSVIAKDKILGNPEYFNGFNLFG